MTDNKASLLLDLCNLLLLALSIASILLFLLAPPLPLASVQFRVMPSSVGPKVDVTRALLLPLGPGRLLLIPPRIAVRQVCALLCLDVIEDLGVFAVGVVLLLVATGWQPPRGFALHLPRRSR